MRWANHGPRGPRTQPAFGPRPHHLLPPLTAITSRSLRPGPWPAHRTRSVRPSRSGSPRGRSTPPSTRRTRRWPECRRRLKAHGVAAKDMQTSNVSLYSYTTHPKGQPVARHYSMSESLTATLRSIDKASAAISDAVSAGGPAVNLDQVSLDLTDDSALVTAARKAAFESAKGKAAQYAGLSGSPARSGQQRRRDRAERAGTDRLVPDVRGSGTGHVGDSHREGLPGRRRHGDRRLRPRLTPSR